MQISDILSVEGADTFTRPIYAGNAIATVQTSDKKLVITVRGTAFAKASATGGSGTIEAVSGEGGASAIGVSPPSRVRRSPSPSVRS
jgi:electron transfer flavoprotein alpha subunit